MLQVILIHLSNITGLNEEYSKRTMSLLVSDIGTIVMGATAAMSKAPTKVRSGSGHSSSCSQGRAPLVCLHQGASRPRYTWVFASHSPMKHPAGCGAWLVCLLA